MTIKHRITRDFHKILAKYYNSKPLFLDGHTQKKPNVRKLMEQPWQLTKAKYWYKLKKTITDLSFLQEKSLAFNIFIVLDDYVFAINQISQINKNFSEISEFFNSLDKNSFWLLKYPNLLSQELLNDIIWILPQKKSLIKQLNKQIKKIYQIWIKKNSQSILPFPENLKRTMQGHDTRPVWEILISNVENLIISKSNDNSIRIWDSETGKLIRVLFNGELNISRVQISISYDGKIFAIGNRQHGKIELFDVKKAVKIKELMGLNMEITALSFSNNGEFLCSGYRDGTIYVWNFKNGTIETKIKHYSLAVEDMCSNLNLNPLMANKMLQKSIPDPIEKVIFSLCSTEIIVAINNVIKVWDCTTGELKIKICGHSGKINNLAITADGTKIAFSSGLSIEIYEISTWEKINSLSFGYMYNDITSISFSSCGKFIAAGSYISTINIWEVETGVLQTVFPGHQDEISSLIFSKNNLLYSASLDGIIKVWNFTELVRVNKHLGISNNQIYTQNLDFFLDSEYFVTTDLATIELRSSKNNEIYSSIKFENMSSNSLQCNAFSNNKKIAFSGSEGITIIYDPFNNNTFSILKKIHGERIQFSKESNFLACLTGIYNDKIGNIKIYDIIGLNIICEITDNNKPIKQIAFSPTDNGKLAYISENRFFIHNIETNKNLLKLEDSQIYLHFTFSQSGKKIALLTIDGTINILESTTGKMINKFKTNIIFNSKLKFISNNLILSVEDKRIIKIWNSINGTMVAVKPFYNNILDIYISENKIDFKIALHYFNKVIDIITFKIDNNSSNIMREKTDRKRESSIK